MWVSGHVAAHRQVFSIITLSDEKSRIYRTRSEMPTVLEKPAYRFGLNNRE